MVSQMLLHTIKPQDILPILLREQCKNFGTLCNGSSCTVKSFRSFRSRSELQCRPEIRLLSGSRSGLLSRPYRNRLSSRCMQDWTAR